MKWFFYKKPMVKGDEPVKTMDFPVEPVWIIEQMALKFGNIQIVDQDEQARLKKAGTL